jgi:hypothetical protein
MGDLEEQIYRTWVQLLVDYSREAAAIAVDTDIIIWQERDELPEIVFDIPISFFGLVKGSDHIRGEMERAMGLACSGHLDISGYRMVDDKEDLRFRYRVKLLDVEEGWQDVVRNLIANGENSNQGLVTEKVFAKKGKHPYIYNEMKFASQSEIKIAMEFEKRGVLFFPLPLAVRAETGSIYEDHREVDFLVCEDGCWGILEVSYHPDRYEKDAEKTTWFKKSGILFVQPYSAERCYETPEEVVDEFLTLLAKHKK